MFSCNQTNNLMTSYNESCDYSDGESIGDSFMGHLSPASSFENWSPAPSDQWSDLEQDFSGLITDAITNVNNNSNNNSSNKQGMNFNQYSLGYNVSSHLSSLPPYNFSDNNMTVTGRDLCRNIHTSQQSSMFQQQQIQQQQRFGVGPMFNNEFTDELDNYLDNASPNPLTNVEDLKNLNVEEFFQNTIDFSAHFSTTQQQQDTADIFHISQSTMDNRSQELLLQYIKQQHQSTDTISNQSSPPPTPCSDWSDIPSPLSVGDYYERKETNNVKLEDTPSTIPKPKVPAPTTAKPGATKPSPPKRKRSSRKQYSTNTGKPRLYKFLREILNDPDTYSCIEWVDKTTGTFKFLDSSEVARLWGFRKNKPAMKYENFARSLRTYIAKGILKKPRNKLVYCFAHPENE